jgi:hypothetical protein
LAIDKPIHILQLTDSYGIFGIGFHEIDGLDRTSQRGLRVMTR